MPETPQEAFDRGTVAGEIAARLADHDQHLAKINGSMGDVAKELHEVSLGMQAIKDQQLAEAKERLATASALEKADHARRQARLDTRWSERARAALVVCGALLAVAGIAFGIYALTH
jgi:crotonobetainyl-CoA:carnitine CoA-transferase CaiB-like acyl-CoA transferase